MKVISQHIKSKGIAISYLFAYYLYISYNSVIISIIVFFLKSIFHFKLYYAPCILCEKPSQVNSNYTNTFFEYAISLKIVLLMIAFFFIKKALLSTIIKEFVIFLFLYDIIFFLLYPFTYLSTFNYLQWYSCSLSYLYSFCRSNNVNIIITFGINSLIGILIYKYLGYTFRSIIFRVILGIISFLSYCFLWYS